ncbi:MAG: hypothetical protein AAF384_12400 [Pseudomonadota bacterium]
MPSFRDVLTAPEEQLVNVFYRIKPPTEADFIKKINQVATQLELNHAQLVCALGFNKHMRDLTDILSVVGFSSFKLLGYRRDELFSTDAYDQLEIDNVVDIYAEHIEDSETSAQILELTPKRLGNIEEKVLENDPAVVISYKMEIHAIYTGGIVNEDFVTQRLSAPIGDLRAMTDELALIIDMDIVPPSNLFFSDDLSPAEKQILIDSGKIEKTMIENRLANMDISEDERQMLEDAL